MATGNFYKEGTKNYYALIPNIPQITYENADEIIDIYGLEKDEYINDDGSVNIDRLRLDIENVESNDFYEYEIYEIMDNVKNELKKLDKITSVRYYEDDEWLDDTGYLFGTINIDEYDEYKDGTGIELVAKIELIRWSGYYEGYTLDYRIEIKAPSYDEYWSVDYNKRNELYSEILKYYGKGKRVIDNFDKKLTKVVERIEEIYKENCTVLGKVAQFSNGETFYGVIEE